MAIKSISVNAVQVDGFKIEAKMRDFTAIVDQPVASGGSDAGPNPLEYMFISLAGCVITIGHIIAKQRHLPVRKIEVLVEGDVETDVFMGKSTATRAGFSEVRVVTKIDADMSQAEKEAFVAEIDARCPISDNIHNLTPIVFVVE